MTTKKVLINNGRYRVAWDSQCNGGQKCERHERPERTRWRTQIVILKSHSTSVVEPNLLISNRCHIRMKGTECEPTDLMNWRNRPASEVVFIVWSIVRPFKVGILLWLKRAHGFSSETTGTAAPTIVRGMLGSRRSAGDSIRARTVRGR